MAIGKTLMIMTPKYWLMLAVIAVLGDSSSAAASTTRSAANLGDLVIKLVAADGEIGDFFGYSVATEDGLALVSAPLKTQVNGSRGLVYMYDVATWQPVGQLTPGGDPAIDNFGASVAMDGGTVIIGAPGFEIGAAYVFDLVTRERVYKLAAEDGASQDRFGEEVAIDGSIALVGAHMDDDHGSSSGSAYLFNLSTGKQLWKLTSSDAAPNDQFGNSVAVEGSLAIVGAAFDDDHGANSGAAYLFDVSTGRQLLKLSPDDAMAVDLFGRSVTLKNGLAYVGAINSWADGRRNGAVYAFDATTGRQVLKIIAEDVGREDEFGSSDEFGEALTVRGTLAAVGAALDDDAGSSSGSAYVFDATTGRQLLRLNAYDAAEFDAFGNSVAIGNGLAIIGAYFDGKEIGHAAGSVYVYRVPEPSGIKLVCLAVISSSLVWRNFGSTRRRS
jgi:outer membrane protein assembly factor BamB